MFDPDTRRLRDTSGDEIKLRYRSREVLAVLASQRGRTVSRRQLVEAVWDVATVSDDSIAHCIAEIRKAVRDRDRRIVETVPCEGYRLNALEFPQISPSTCGLGTDRVNEKHEGGHHEDRAPVVAVLPFEDIGLSGVPSEPLRASLGEAIISDLARYPELTVISRAASFRFAPDRKPDDVISRLNSNYLVTGSVQGDTETLRVGFQLVTAADMSCVWVETIDVEPGEILMLSSSIGRRVANAIGSKIIDVASSRVDFGDVSSMLIENAARSRILRLRSRTAWERNIAEQEFALGHYPDSVWCVFGQSLALNVGLSSGWIHGEVDNAISRAESLVSRALDMAPENYLCHYALGRSLVGKGEMTRAVGAFEHAARLNPASTLVLSGLLEPLLSFDDTSRAISVIKQVERIHPIHSGDLSCKKAWIQWRMGQPEDAISTILAIPNCAEIDIKLLSILYLELGDLDAARRALRPYLVANRGWNFAAERARLETHWTPEDLRDTWMSRLSQAGMPA